MSRKQNDTETRLPLKRAMASKSQMKGCYPGQVQVRCEAEQMPEGQKARVQEDVTGLRRRRLFIAHAACKAGCNFESNEHFFYQTDEHEN